MDSTTSYTTSTEDIAQAHEIISSGATAGLVLFSLLALTILTVIILIAMGKIFKKAGRPAWAAWIPFYNTWVWYELAGRPGWWMILTGIPVVGVVLLVIASLDIAKKFNKSTLFAVLGLIFFYPIGVMMLGFGNSQYSDDDEVDSTTVYGQPSPVPQAPFAAQPQQPQIQPMQPVQPQMPQAPQVQPQQPSQQFGAQPTGDNNQANQ